MARTLADDMFLLENQLPLFILADLFDLAKREMHSNLLYEGLSMSKLTFDLWELMAEVLLIEDKLFEEHFPEAEHFLDLIRLCLQPSELGNQNGKLETLSVPTITELHQAGVKFKLGSSNHLFDIRFKNGTLEIPQCTIVDETEFLIANLQDLELLNGRSKNVIHYVVIMNYLVNSPKDVEVLAHKGIIENGLPDSEDVSTLFQKLQKEADIDSDNFYYSGLIEDLKAYCKSPWHNWKATLKQNYFNTPWASISVIAAVVLLILTVIQTVFSIINK
ncbi:hypothetical protein Patl1_29639 [Pistacia atlantica]|uniref:Uncharacterized protein n=1 Tax=Pistacia atlantica TaxID=434234 RepID=A0ACC1A7E7_9ROSI|nr:hypothetical protein Patl1_29639 [Pistacia atlantica]